jgi:hypothetical protein
MSEEKFCESCGMPLRQPKDFGGGKPDNKYCVHCTDEDGGLKPFEVVFAGMQQFAIMNMGVSEEEALKIAKETMAKMPAWAERQELA